MRPTRDLHRRGDEAERRGEPESRARKARVGVTQREIERHERKAARGVPRGQAPAGPRVRGHLAEHRKPLRGAAELGEVPGAGMRARAAQQRHRGRGERGAERRVQRLAPPGARDERQGEQPEPEHDRKVLQALVAERGGQPSVAQGKAARLRRIGERLQPEVEPGVHQAQPDGERGEREPRRLPGEPAPQRRARAAGGTCSSSAYRPLRKTCAATW